MVFLDALANEFIFEAKQATYANESPKKIVLPDNHIGLRYACGEFEYLDSYRNIEAEGAPFEGVEKVLRNKQEILALDYKGALTSEAEDFCLTPKETYRILRIALRNVPFEFPVRGPSWMSISSGSNTLSYSFEMDTSSFFSNSVPRIGKETLTMKRQIIYTLDCTLRTA